MSWIRSGLHSISIPDWRMASPPATAAPSGSLDQARKAMLESLGEAGWRAHPALQLRIRNAVDARVLWGLRPSLMDAIAQMHGELEGRQRLGRVTQKFEGLLPGEWTARRGRLPVSAAVR